LVDTSRNGGFGAKRPFRIGISVADAYLFIEAQR